MSKFLRFGLVAAGLAYMPFAGAAGTVGCWRVSEFLPKPGSRSLDLSWLEKVKTATNWVNGTDGDGLYAFSGTDAAVTLRRYQGSTRYGGVYSFSDGIGQELGLLAVGERGVYLVLPVCLDSERPLERLSVSYVLRRLAWDESATDTTLEFSWKTSDEFRAMEDLGSGWTVAEECGYVATADGEGRVERQLDFSRESLGEAKYLFLRWSVSKHANSALIGLSDLTLSGELCKLGLMIIIK